MAVTTQAGTATRQSLPSAANRLKASAPRRITPDPIYASDFGPRADAATRLSIASRIRRRSSGHKGIDCYKADIRQTDWERDSHAQVRLPA